MKRLLIVLLLLWLPGTAAASSWVPPLAGPLAVDRAFSAPTTAYGPGHRGVDLRGTAGQSVRAAGAGRISYAGLLAGRGVVTVTHADGLRTTYEPVTVTVRTGQPIGAGQALGSLVGGHCQNGAACLHWGLLRGDTYLDPMSLLGPAAVRLLPLEGSAPGGPASSGSAGAAAGGALDRVPTVARPVQRLVPAEPPPSPHLVLRAVDRASGAAAVALLGLGLLLLVRRPGIAPPPHHPAPTALVSPAGADGAVAGTPVDLQAERTRRHSAQAAAAAWPPANDRPATSPG